MVKEKQLALGEESETEVIDGDEYEEVKAVGWKPTAAGDILAGTYLGMQENVGEFESTLYHIKTKDGILVGFFGNTVLDDKMQAVGIGEDIAIKYLGMKKSEGAKKPYHDYVILRKKKLG